MHWKLLLSLLLSLHLLVRDVLAAPVIHGAVGEDASFIREPRLTVATEVEDLMSASNAPESRDSKKSMKNTSGKSDEGGYYTTYGSDAEGEKGYLKETYGKGDQGYKTLDTFHKQNGDRYEFETQTTFGKGLEDDNERKHRVKEGQKQKKKEHGDHEGAGTIVDHSDYTGGGEADHGEASEYSRYSGSDDGDDHYSGDRYSGQYAEKEPEESTRQDHSENYFSRGDDNGSYEMSHGSYSSDGEEEEEGERY